MTLCPFCQQQTDSFPSSALSYEVIGWERTRHQGGTNALALRKRTGTVAHAHCVDKAKQGLTGQDALWSE